MLHIPESFAAVTDASTQQSVRYLDFISNRLVLCAVTGELGRVSNALAAREVALGTWQSSTWIARQFDEAAILADDHKSLGLRALFGKLDNDSVAIASLGLQLLEWDRTHQHCGACGTPTTRERHERARRCPACGHTSYPRISPAMMCLVTHGNQILLARNANFPPGRYSALAGFLEAGESVEDAVHREVREEVGIEVRNLRYFASQSWPFPHSLMIAFTAEYASGELKPNGTEIVDAIWCDRETLPELPPEVSIARALIDHTLSTLGT
ncbi:MAG: NAD(+) diphosphatase [Burkholderiales bacterium]|nr:MAG: NAD(+) diphosphatase [Burkholderiales bacterium]TAG79298.1 MAG: NAD(+) diphosphatase [Betaproteobacteria bacterium]